MVKIPPTGIKSESESTSVIQRSISFTEVRNNHSYPEKKKNSQNYYGVKSKNGVYVKVYC